MRQALRYSFSFTLQDVNPNLIKANYPLAKRINRLASEIEKDLQTMDIKNIRNEKYYFDKIIKLNVEHPQALNYQPISFNRQVLACIVNNDLFKVPNISDDVKNRARFYQEAIGCVGGYSDSTGFPLIKRQIAQFIQRRDLTHHEVDINSIILTDGVTQGANIVLGTILKDNSEGVLIPAPGYAFYSSYVTKCGAHNIPYYLTEKWDVTKDELDKQLKDAISRGVKPKAIVVVNPGNPTGHLYSRATLETIIRFASDHKLIIIADEVYQDIVYHKKFVSLRKIREEMPNPYNYVELCSLHSISKGFMSESGFRGGYVQFSQMDEDVIKELEKAKELISESNNIGQLALGLMATPPTREEGCSEETIETYWEQRTELVKGLRKNSEVVYERLNDVRGVFCESIEGSVFAFPRFDVTTKFLEEAKKQGYTNPDEFYCMNALEEIGVVIQPGSMFLQKPGTHHFRMSIVTKSQEEQNQALIAFRFWHERFMKNYE